MGKESRLGEKFITNQGYEAEIIEYFGATNCTVQFNDEFKTINYKVIYHSLTVGSVNNRHHRVAYGVGYIGYGKYKIEKSRKNYNVWIRMMERAYSKKYHQKQPTYKDVTVCEEWHNFQNFAKWFEENYNPEIMQDWHLDKDIICPDCKVYSPETCTFVPTDINFLFTKRQNKRGDYPIGVSYKSGKFRATMTRNNSQFYMGAFSTPNEAFQAYKKGKEDWIKIVANKWKDKIKPEVYDALINYKVEITD